MPDALAASPAPTTPLSAGGPGIAQQMQANDAETQKILSAESAQMKPAVDKASSLLSADAPKAPSLQAAPESPKLKEEQAHNAQEFLASAILISGIAGALSRSHVTTALNAFGATIKGYREGQIQAGQEAFEEFKSASEAVKANNAAMQTEYQNALADRKMGIDQQMAQVQLIATQYHDQLMAQAAGSKNYLLVAQLQERNFEATEKFSQAAEKMYQQHTDMMTKLAAGLAVKGYKFDENYNPIPDPDSPITKGKETLSSQALDAAAIRYATTGQIAAGMGGAQMRTAVMNRSAELMSAAGLSPEEVAVLPAEKKADASALVRDTAWIDGVERGQTILKGMFPIAEEYMKKLSLTEIQRVNSLIVGGAQEFGSADANNYANAMTTIALEYGRVMAGPQSAAMLPVEAIKIGMGRVGNLTPDQFKGEQELINKEAANSVAAQEKIIAKRRQSLESLKPSDKPSASGGGADEMHYDAQGNLVK